MPITADRGGVTAKHWYESGIKTEALVDRGEVKLVFALDSKGGGQTHVQVNIGPVSFQEVFNLMLECDFEKAVTGFSKALAQREKQRRR